MKNWRILIRVGKKQDMEATRCLCLSLWLFVIVTRSNGKVETCRPVPLTDVHAAMIASHDIYRNKISVGKNVSDTTYKVVKLVTPTLKGESLKAFIATSGSTTLICFRGTMSEKQLIHQFQSALRPAKFISYGGKYMRVMQYFWDALMIFNPDTLIPGGIKADTKYIVTGHSLGGALASLFSIHMKLRNRGIWRNSQSTLITFGAPRVGDKRFAEIHDQLISPDRKLRFVYRYDIVPHLPPAPLYSHHSREIWIWKKPVLGWWFKVYWKTYWTVCKCGDTPSGCSGDTRYAEPFTHHYTHYRKAVLAQPTSYYDKFGYSQNSFTDSQCR